LVVALELDVALVSLEPVEPVVPVDPLVAGGVTFTEVDEEALGVVLSAGGLMLVVLFEATGGGVVVLGTTTVVSFEADGDGVVVEVVVVRSHAASDAPRVRAATRGSSFMFSPYEVWEATC
jgi:hypothetical protein